jgi:hypothetical protein
MEDVIDSNNNINSPAEQEQMYFNQINDIVNNAVMNIQQISHTNPSNASVGINYIDTVENQLRSFISVAQSLYNAGFPNLYARINELLNDAERAKQVFVNGQQISNIRSIFNQSALNLNHQITQAQTSQTINDVFDNIDSVNEKSHKNWTEYIRQ